MHIHSNLTILSYNYGALHMTPVDRDGSVTEIKLVSIFYGDFKPAFRDENFEKVVTRPFRCKM